MRRLLFFLLLAAALHAAMPKTYSSISDPVYRAVAPVRTLAALKSFADDRQLFTSFVDRAAVAEKEGKWIDTHKTFPEAKQRSKQYLQTLRGLQRLNLQIGERVKAKLTAAMQKRQTRLYYAIKKSGYPALMDDPALHREMARFESRLKKEQERTHARKMEQKEAHLRSYANLKGAWQAKTASGKAVVYRFTDQTHIVIAKRDSAREQTLEGTWRIRDNTLEIALTRVTNKMADGVPHVRETAVTLQMRIVTIGKKKMTLYDTRRKKEQTFFRYDTGR